MDCIRCHTTMEKSTVLGVVSDTCPSCRGTWLDAGELKMLEDGQRKSYDEMMTEIKEEQTVEQEQILSVIGLCPKCQKAPMQLVNYRGVELDYCPSCKGLYFDMGELKEVIRRKPATIG